jgi:gliding motility-associated protein GldL
LIPGLGDYNAKLQPIQGVFGGGGGTAPQPTGNPLDGKAVEGKLGSMLVELQTMSKSLGALKALQEVDFSGTQDQVKAMNSFYGKMTEAMANMSDAMDDTKKYKDQMAALNKNLSSLNNVYGGMLSAMSNVGK